MVNLNNLSIKNKIRLLVTIPSIAYILIACWLLINLGLKALEANQLEQQIALFSDTSKIITAIEKERDLATSYLGGGNEVLDFELQSQKNEELLLSFKSILSKADINNSLKDNFINNLPIVTEVRATIAAIEAGEDDDTDAETIIYDYEQIIRPLMAIEKNIATAVQLEGIGKYLSSTILLEQAKSDSGKIQGLVAGIIAEDEPIEDTMLNIILAYKSNVDQSLMSNALIITEQNQQLIVKSQSLVHWEILNDTYDVLIDNYTDGEFDLEPKLYIENSLLAQSDIKNIIDQELQKHQQTASDLKLQNQIVIGFTLIILIAVASLIILLINKISDMIVHPIQSMVDIMESIESTSDFSLRTELSNDDEIGRAGLALNQLLTSLQQAINSVTIVVDGIAQGDFSKRIEDNFKGDLEKLKTGVNNSAQSVEIAISEVVSVMTAVKNGDFSARIDAKFDGQLNLLKENINSSVDSIYISISDINSTMKLMSAGDFSSRIEADLQGDLQTLKENVNTSMAGLEVAITEIRSVSEAQEQGDFTARVTGVYSGELESLKSAINASANSIGVAIGEINLSMEALNNGDFSNRISAEFNGDLQRLKENLNGSMGGLARAIQDITHVAQAQQLGDFDVRITGQYTGELNSLKTAINSSADSFSGAISEINDVMRALKNGIFSKRVHIELNGDLNTLKLNLNESLDGLENAIEEIVQVSSAQQKGDLVLRVSGSYAGKLSDLKVAMNETATNLNNAMSKIAELSATVNSTSVELSHGNNELSRRAESQAASLEETSSTVKVLTEIVIGTAKNTEEALKISLTAQESATSGGEVIRDAIKAMADISESSQQIGGIISTIKDITFQTNLLALNAAVEAARAGEQGRGFAVVASEVRNLALRSANAAQEISTLISNSIEKVKAGTDLVNTSGVVLEEIVENVLNVSTLIKTIAAAANEQKSSFTEVSTAIDQLDEITQYNAATAEEASAASDTLTEQAKQMRNLINFFHVKG